ncbi:MAG: asparagine synthase (glutamine-hydrolyzing) [Fidelibacterota bacterium]
MCGIAGFISKKFSQQEKSNILEKMCDKIAYRGPDDSGYFVIDDFAIGMRRLRVIDINTGDQPIFNEDRSLAIVFNGEIYNYRKLRRRLQAAGHIFKTQSDTEVILHLYEEEGVNCLDKLRGMFVFAILDLNRDSLFLARDRFGIKPLYYYHNGGDFIFGSELKSILAFPAFKKELNYEAMNYYLTFESVPAPLSIFKNIHKLEQSHYLELSNNKLTRNQYYFLEFQPKYSSRDVDFYVQELDWLIGKAVERRKVSDVPLGAFLSGGIDSSLIAAYLSKSMENTLKTFSIGFAEDSFDETSHARFVSGYLDTEHFEKIFTPGEMMDILPEIVRNMDEPFADDSILPTYLLSQLTRENVTVALSGDGGDEIFAGYPTYLARKIGGFMPKFSHYLLNPVVNMLPTSDENISFDFKAKKFVAGLKYDPDIRHQIWLGSFDPNQKKHLLSPELLNVLGKKVQEFEIIKQHMKRCQTENNWERSLWLDIRFYLQDNMLVKVDRASMMNSLEVRVPFLDKEVVEFMAKVPARLKYRGLTSKYLLKRLAKKYLPEKIINRPKKGFGIPVTKWIKSDLKGEFLQTLSKQNIQHYNFFNYDYIDGLMQDHLNEKQDNRKLLWTLYIFQKWLDEYYD